MSSTKTDIYNMALAHLAITKTLTDINVDADPPIHPSAKALGAFYNNARDTIFRAALWPFATVIDELVLVDTDPTPDWAYSYEYPPGAERLVRIVPDLKPETESTRIPFRVIGTGASGKLVLTDRENAEAEFIQVVDEEEWPADFVMAFALLLAFMAAPALTGGDKNKLGMRAYAGYRQAVIDAFAMAANEEAAVIDNGSSFIDARR